MMLLKKKPKMIIILSSPNDDQFENVWTMPRDISGILWFSETNIWT